MAASKALRTRVYIDGYNLYYGCLKGSPYKWLDPLVLFEQHVIPTSMPPGMHAVFLQLSIKYFTAKIVERAAKAEDSVSSQARYHSALRKLYEGRIELVEGYYSIVESKAKIVDGPKWPRDCDEIVVWKLEEKQSDVNLALQAYHDAITGEVDQVVVVTNDTDIVPALALIRKHTSVIVNLGPDELALVQTTQAHPDTGAVPAHQFQAGSAPVGKHVGRAIARRPAQGLLHVKRESVDAGAHVHRCRRQPDRVSRQLHHRARINSASQLAGTSPGKVNLHPRSLHSVIARAAAVAGATRTGINAGSAWLDLARRLTQ